jgi:hypothetical protein
MKAVAQANRAATRGFMRPIVAANGNPGFTLG